MVTQLLGDRLACQKPLGSRRDAQILVLQDQANDPPEDIG
jgi:hypothetical protein